MFACIFKCKDDQFLKKSKIIILNNEALKSRFNPYPPRQAKTTPLLFYIVECQMILLAI